MPDDALCMTVFIPGSAATAAIAANAMAAGKAAEQANQIAAATILEQTAVATAVNINSKMNF